MITLLDGELGFIVRRANVIPIVEIETADNLFGVIRDLFDSVNHGHSTELSEVMQTVKETCGPLCDLLESSDARERLRGSIGAYLVMKLKLHRTLASAAASSDG